MYELDFENILAKYPELIEAGLSLEGRQVSIKGKYIDLLFKDNRGGRLIVELKRGTVLRKDIGQLMDYEGELLFPDDPTVRGMLIGNRVPPSLGRSLDHHGLEWREFSIAYLIEFLRKKNDNEFLQCFSSEEVQQRTVGKPIKELKQSRVKVLSGSSSETWDKVRKVFDSSHLGETLTRKQIIDMIEAAYPETNRDSVIPSDYCYNKVNKDIRSSKFYYFEYLRDVRRGDPQYKVLGEGFDYEGVIYWKDKIVGEWIKGEREPHKGKEWQEWLSKSK